MTAELEGLLPASHRAFRRIARSGVIAVMRGMEAESVVQIARALLAGGVEVLEVTVDAPRAMAMIERVQAELGGEALIGAGTVLDAETARAAILAGAEFIFTPTVDAATIRMAKRYGKAIICGAFTPTEILNAYASGADAIKVFPANAGGPDYIKQIKAPLAQVPLIPTGGVDLGNIGDFIKAGAVAAGIGSALVSAARVKRAAWGELTAAARQLVDAVAAARG
ncbi:MAG TPA: bifunctional 4-hydroxy-2-oxoglutarate aldolase/2-dehydro-3-deoxy-phosphogluconate aldolase [Limnochordia bacterium]|nr:bifunctional 4-hydroxy-2-oxoglutarate aldolase/2-dehydro-3-deoxy-phosphogluconate aldolase [Limnochordia bacterium]